MQRIVHLLYVGELFSELPRKGRRHMGFWDTLGKVVDTSCDFMAELAKTNAKSLDRMSDEEIEKRHFKSAQVIRKDAVTMSDAELKRKYSRTAGEIRRDVAEMSDEDLEIKYSKSADEMRMKADTLQMQAEMWQMKKEEREMQAEIMRMKQEQRDGYNEYERMNEYSECDDDF